MKYLNAHNLLFWLGIGGVIASGIATQFAGTNAQVALVASSIVAILAKLERGIQAYEASNDSTTTTVATPTAVVQSTAPTTKT